MANVNIPIVGPTYENRSLAVGNQHTQNFYIEINEHSKEPVSLVPFPGLKLFSTAGTGKGRGSIVYGGTFYTVSGTELYSVSSIGTATLIGTIPGTNRVGLADDETNLVITNGIGKPYAYNGTTLTQGTDADLPNANTVAYINGRVVYDGPTGLSFADPGLPLAQNSANILLSNTRQDACLAVHTHRQQVLAFNEKTIEPSYAIASTVTPPYQRINSAVQEIGTASAHSVASNKDFIYFLGNDRRVYRMSSLASQAIDNPAIGQAIANYATVSDCFGLCFTLDSQNFYLLSFPAENKTWLYNESSNLWTSLAYGTTGAAHLISSYSYVYGKHLVSDRRNGNIYELDFETFTDNGDVIQRTRTTKAISGKDFGKPGSTVFQSSLTLTIEPGVSLVTAQANIIVQYSDDSGRTWSSERWASIGDQGDYTYVLMWQGLGMFKGRMFKFIMSDPVKWVLVSLEADLEVGID